MSSNSYIPTQPNPPNLDSTMALLDSLTTFYTQEREWVYRTRASLELATYQSSLNDPDVAGTSKNDAPPTPPPSAMATTEKDKRLTTPVVKTEPASPAPFSTSETRWLQRKKRFKLHLEGIS